MKRWPLLLALLIGFISLACGGQATATLPPGDRADGAELIHAPDTPASAQNPAFSPDGTRLLFTHFDNGYNDGPAGLFLLNLSSGQTTRLTPAEDQDNVSLPGAAWSDVNDRIIFSSDRAEVDDLWRIAAPSLTLSYLPVVACVAASRVLASTSELTHSIYLPLLLNHFSPLGQVNDFLFQLQNLDLTAIGDTAYDLVVMDYAADGDEATEFTAAQINALKHSPGGDKIVLAYMSIGEAEEYRFYWQTGWTPGNPVWLDEENAEWPGNYKVRYWDPDWQAIIFGYTDRLLDAGFDGAYLDLVDAYEYYAGQGRATAAQEMADFVAAIRAHARDRDPDFYIIAQNGADLVERVPTYMSDVDGIGHESVYYSGDGQPTPPDETTWVEQYLDMFKDGGKLVLTVDYAIMSACVDDAYAKSQDKGYVPFCTVRDLDQLIINLGHEPD